MSSASPANRFCSHAEVLSLRLYAHKKHRSHVVDCSHFASSVQVVSLSHAVCHCLLSVQSPSLLLSSCLISAGLDSGDRPMQLRDLAAALRKSEDVSDKLRALKNLEGALLAAPDELKHYASQSLLCQLDCSPAPADMRHPFFSHVHASVMIWRKPALGQACCS